MIITSENFNGGALRIRGGVLVQVLGMPHVSPMHPLRMPDAELTHIHSISPLWGFGLDEGEGDGDGHASIMREASDSYASPMPFTTTFTNTNTVHLQQQVRYVCH